MKPSTRFLFFLLSWITLYGSALKGQNLAWQPTGGPYHGTANCFIKGPNNYLYAGTEVGVFRTPIDHDAWELVSNGILDLEVVTLTADSSGVLYAGTAEGAFRSFDEGVHWEIVNFGLGNTYVSALLAAPQGVVLAGTGNGIYRSTDQASSWTKAIVDSADTLVLCLAVYPSGLLFAGGVSGLMHSTDDGEHWTHINNNLIHHTYTGLAINRWGYMAAFGPSPGGGETLGWFGLSKDSGATFVAASGAGAFDNLEQPSSIALGDSNSFFIGTYYNEHSYPHNGFLRKGKWVDNAGHPFLWQTPLSSIAGPLRSIFVSENLVFASGANVICSTDSGLSYHDFIRGLTGSRILSLTENFRRTVFAGTQFALFQRTDTLASWSSPSFLYAGSLLPIFCLTSTSAGLILAGTAQEDYSFHSGLWFSSDFGSSWHSTAWEYRTNAVAVNSLGQWFGTLDRRLRRGRSADTPDEILKVELGLTLPSVAVGESTEVYAGSSNGTIYCSYDTGTTWTSTQLVPAGNVQSLVTAFGGRVYAGTSVGFFASSDRGSSWVQRGRGEVPSNIRVLVAKPGVGIFAGTPDGVYRSMDEGEDWEALNEGLTVKEIYSLCFGTDGSLYAGTSGGGVFRLPLEMMLSVQLASFSVTQAAGGSVQLHWVTTSEIDNHGFEVQRRLAGQTDFVTLPNSFCTGHGTSAERHEYTLLDTPPSIGQWQYRLKQIGADSLVHYTEALSVQVTTDVKDDSQLPTAYALSQNYPNPFNPRTVVSSQLPVASDVRMVIYDVLGREVAVLVDERRAAGRYQDSYDASALASGVYVYRMTAGPFVASRKMILVK